MNDPQWGRGGGSGDGGEGQRPRRPNGQDGPPDLEELWRELSRRVGNLFGSAPGGGAFRALVGVSAVLAAILFVWMCTGFYIVQEGQVAVVSTFGRFDTITGAGFRWRAPWPIQSHQIVDVFSQREIEVGTKVRGPDRLKEALMLTDDENIVDMQYKVQYRIKSGPDGARDFVFGSRFLPDGDPNSVVRQVAESAMREVVGHRKMDSVLSESQQVKTDSVSSESQQIADEVRERMQAMLDRYSTGILVTVVAIQNAQPPEQVQAAFIDAVQAGQDRQRQVNEGQAYANDVVPRARGASSRLIQEAEGYRTKTVETAQGDAARFREVLAEYAKAPGVTRERLYLDTMQQIFANTTKVMVDLKTSSQLLYLPLDKLLQQSAAETAHPGAPASSTPAAGTPPSGGAEARARETPGERDRDRESR